MQLNPKLLEAFHIMKGISEAPRLISDDDHNYDDSHVKDIDLRAYERELMHETISCPLSQEKSVSRTYICGSCFVACIDY